MLCHHTIQLLTVTYFQISHKDQDIKSHAQQHIPYIHFSNMSPPKSRRGRKPRTVSKKLDYTGREPVMIVKKSQKRKATEKSMAVVNIGVGRQELAQMVRTNISLLEHYLILNTNINFFRPRRS